MIFTELDARLTRLALLHKNLVVVDFSFERGRFPEFHRLYESRYVVLPCRTAFAGDFALGLSSLGKLVVLVGLKEAPPLDPTANVKYLIQDSSASWELLDKEFSAFGPQVLLIP